MLAAVLILILCLFVAFFIPNYHDMKREKEAEANTQTKKLWRVVQTSLREKKPARAEKALLTILKFDEKNAAAYNRLGIIYAKDKHFDEAIECFEIAQSLDNNASSLHNVGLIYYETGNFEKAVQAFEHAIEIDGGEPARYIAYAKALEKVGKRAKAVESLESAYELNPDENVLKHLLELYENSGDEKNIEITKQRITRLQNKKRTLLGYNIDDTSARTVKNARSDKENARASARAAKILAQAEAKKRKAEEQAAKRQRIADLNSQKKAAAQLAKQKKLAAKSERNANRAAKKLAESNSSKTSSKKLFKKKKIG